MGKGTIPCLKPSMSTSIGGNMHNHLVYFLVFLLVIFLAIIAAISIAVETAPKQPTPIVEGTGLKDTTPWARTLSETGIGGK